MIFALIDYTDGNNKKDGNLLGTQNKQSISYEGVTLPSNILNNFENLRKKINNP